MTLPTLTGLVPYPVEQAIRGLDGGLTALTERVAAIPAPKPPLTLEEIRAALGATGGSPLNIFQLLGQDAAAGAIQLGTHAQRLATLASVAGKGALWYETDRSALYAALTVSGWTLIGSWGLRGTLSPDQKPADLGTRDTNFLFISTDFDRTYRWTGAAWADAPGQPARGQIVYFPSAFAPTTGWALCNGTGTTASTATGGTAALTPPDLTTATRFIRSVAGATGGTGGSATTHTHTIAHDHAVDPPSTTSAAPPTPTYDKVVDVGAAITVSAFNHTHAVDIASFTSGGSSAANSGAPSGAGGVDALPPYLDERPYIRL